jgi:ATP-dependent Clp protease ATP-binding subunit ClpB
MSTFDSYDEWAQGVIRTTYELAQKQNDNPVDVPHLFFVLLNQSDNAILDLLKQGGANMEGIKAEVRKSLIGLLSAKTDFSISQELNDILQEANAIAGTMKDSQTSVYHIFLALIKSNTPLSKKLIAQWVIFDKMKSIVEDMPKAKLHAEPVVPSLERPAQGAEALRSFSDDLTQLARDKKLKEVIGRDKELKKIIEILCRKEKNNVVVLGDSWVGKTAVIELLAQKIVADDIPDFLKGKQILRINLGSLLAGTKFRGEFEDKVSQIIKTVKASDGKIVLFIDEFHNVAGAGKSEGSMDLSEMLKPELSSGTIQIIWATSTSNFRQKVEKDTGLTRNVETIILDEPNIQDTITILRGIEWSFEKHHGVTIYDSALVAAAELSDRYIKDSKLPDKAIKILDQAAVKVNIAMTGLPEDLSTIKTTVRQLSKEKQSLLEEVSSDPLFIASTKERITKIDEQILILQKQYNTGEIARFAIKDIFEENKKLNKQILELSQQADKDEQVDELQKTLENNLSEFHRLQQESKIHIKDTVEREDIAQVVAEKTGIPLTKMIDEESQKLTHLEKHLSSKVIGQDEAIAEISNAIRRARVWLKDPKKPIGSFIFLGPTGVGKTELAKALAEFLFFDKKAMVRFNMSEYKEEHSASKLIGSPPGYIGYEEWGRLTEAIRRKPYSVILLDEVEKAHQGVFDLFLQVFDDGMLDDSLGNTVDFKNTIIIMTSNIGSHEIMEKLQGETHKIGNLYPETQPEIIETPTETPAQIPHKKRHRSKKKNNTELPSKEEEKSLTEELKEELQPILMDFFRPEFLNRLDANIIFNPISPEMLKNILEIKIKEQINLVYASNQITLEFTNQAKNYLAKKWRDPANGARPINRALQKYIIDPLSLEIVSWKIQKWDKVIITIENNRIIFKNQYNLLSKESLVYFIYFYFKIIIVIFQTKKIIQFYYANKKIN